jgi:DNA-binding transcriptional LysR family regulator
MFDQMRAMAVFWKVAETGSFRGAAKALGLSPSVVSHHVSSLEDQLGTALLYRSTRRLSLTDAGTALFEASGRMVAAAQDGLDAVRNNADQPFGRLRIAAAGAVFQSPPYFDHLMAFARTYPKAELKISFSDQKIDLLGSAFDVALRIGWVEDSQYKARKLADLGRVLVASPEYLATKPVPRSVDDLSGWAWVKLEQIPINRQLVNSSGAVPQIDPRHVLEVDSVIALCSGARLGMGVAAVPRTLVAGDLRDGRLVALSPNWQLMPVGVYAVWPNNVAADGLPIRFVRFMAGKMADA